MTRRFHLPLNRGGDKYPNNYTGDLLAYGAVLNGCLNVLFNFILMRRFGVAGIALSTSLVYLISCIFLGFWALKLLRKEESAACLS
jgi:Na+-driven multidrug efflux pump